MYGGLSLCGGNLLRGLSHAGTQDAQLGLVPEKRCGKAFSFHILALVVLAVVPFYISRQGLHYVDHDNLEFTT